MSDETEIKEVSGDGKVDATPVATTVPETKPETSVSTNGLSALEQRLAQIEGRLAGVPNEEAVAERVRKDPRFKQALSDMTKARVQTAVQEEIDKRVSALDELAETTADPDVLANIEKQKKAIAKQVKQEYATKPAEAPEPPPQQPPAQDEAARMLFANGLSWQDVATELTASPGGLQLSQFSALIAKKVAARESANKEAEWMKKYEQQTKQVRQADTEGATILPPEGKVETQKKRTLADADDIGSAIAGLYAKK